MSTYSASASTIGFVTTTGSSSWTKGKAYQGQYSGYSNSRVGAFVFSNLRSIDWTRQVISQITLRFTYANAGDKKSKTVTLYAGTKTGLSGSGTAMRGSQIGAVSSNGNAYGGSHTITFSSTSNSTAFNNFVNYLQTGTATTLAIYNGETISASSGWTSNYLCVTAATLTVTYDVAGSTGTISPNPQELGARVHCYINPITVSGSTVTHSVQWKCGTRQSVDTIIDAGVTDASYIIPTSWVSEFTTTTSMPAECILSTYVDGAKRGSQTLPFTIVVPQSMYPTFSYTTTATASMSGYYQHLNAATIAITNASAQEGATIASYSITGTESVSSTSSSVTTPVFSQSGTHTYTLSVTDSRGAITTKTATISVVAVVAPTITGYSVKRYATTYDDQHQPVYTESPSGDHVWVTATISIDSAGGNNTMGAYILWGQADGSLTTRVNLTVSGTSQTFTKDRTVITAQIPVGDAYAFELHVTDKHYNVSAYSRVDKSIVPLHIAGSGYGVGLGMYSDGTQAEPKIQAGWPIYANGGIWGADGNRIDGQTAAVSDTITTLNSNFTLYNAGEYPVVTRYGNVVELVGALKPTTTLASSATTYVMFTLPLIYRPAKLVRVLCQGASVAVWMLSINTSGEVMISRYRDSNGYADLTTSAYLPFYFVWTVGDADIPDTSELYGVKIQGTTLVF